MKSPSELGSYERPDKTMYCDEYYKDAYVKPTLSKREVQIILWALQQLNTSSVHSSPFTEREFKDTIGSIKSEVGFKEEVTP